MGDRAASVSQLRRAQSGLCYLCAEELGPRGVPAHRYSRRGPKSERCQHNRELQERCTTGDHVFPKSAGYGLNGNKLLAHNGCNAAKGDRMPHPCERLYLEAVNLALGLEMPIWLEEGRERRVLILERYSVSAPTLADVWPELAPHERAMFWNSDVADCV